MADTSARHRSRRRIPIVKTLAAAGVVAAYRVWPVVQRGIATLDASVPYFPALVWLMLMVLRLVSGPLLPRI